MTDDPDGNDEMLVSRLRAYASERAMPRDPTEIVGRVIGAGAHRGRARFWGGRIPAAFGAAVLVAVISSLGIGLLLTGSSSNPATATVEGREYAVAAGRGFALPVDRLSPYAEATRINDGHRFEDATTYAIEGIDPARVLVLKLMPGQRDDVGPLGAYFLLLRGQDAMADLCHFLDPANEAPPRACR